VASDPEARRRRNAARGQRRADQAPVRDALCHWINQQRTNPVPALDALNADGETPAWQNWTPSTPEERAAFGDELVADIQELDTYVHSDDFQKALDAQGVAGLSNGAIALLDEVATGKISGEEDWWSGTDLWDFAANVEGSKMAFSLARDFAASKGDAGAALVDEIDAGYAALEASLAKHGSLAEGFVNYRELTDEDKREFTDLINALAVGGKSVLGRKATGWAVDAKGIGLAMESIVQVTRKLYAGQK